MKETAEKSKRRFVGRLKFSLKREDGLNEISLTFIVISCRVSTSFLPQNRRHN